MPADWRRDRYRHAGKALKAKEDFYQSPQQKRRDIITRHAIMRPHEAGMGRRVWFCEQASGRAKPGYRSQAEAQLVADALRALDAEAFVVYRCVSSDERRIDFEHFHLASPRPPRPDRRARRQKRNEVDTPPGGA